MYGLPGQTPDAWLKTLETALGFAPEHLSCYQLTIAAGETPALRTPLARRLARGEFALPDEEAQREFFLLTRQFPEGPGLYPLRNLQFRPEGQGEEYLYAGTTASTGIIPLTWGWGRRPTPFRAAPALVEFFVGGGILLVPERRPGTGGGAKP